MNLILVASGAVTGLLVRLSGVGHLLTGNVDFGLLGKLLLGLTSAYCRCHALSTPAASATKGHTHTCIASIGMKLLGTASV